jgi:hypothetical protein
VDGEETLRKPSHGVGEAGVEMTVIGQKDDENLVTTSVTVDGPTNVKVFSDLRKRL